jgi:hypothetical protein
MVWGPDDLKDLGIRRVLGKLGPDVFAVPLVVLGLRVPYLAHRQHTVVDNAVVGDEARCRAHGLRDAVGYLVVGLFRYAGYAVTLENRPLAPIVVGG